jgi:hypothetical protein
MKSATIVLLLCVATPAICQSAAPAPSHPLQLLQTPPATAKPWMDFSKLPSLKPFSLSTPLRQFIVPKPGAETRWNDAQIDPRIIVHPPQSKLGVQPPGTNIATNQFPNLRFLPIASPGSALQAIPTQWPSLNVEKIPTNWPNFELSLINGEKQVRSLPPAK